MKKYDIFISYRRTNSDGTNIGTQLARTLQKEFERRRYKVFFDYSDCKDEDFVKTIFPAIEASKIFIFLLTEGALDRCVNPKDWVRQEISHAIKFHCKIIPLNPDSSFDNWPSEFPAELEPLKTIQISDISTGSLFEKSIDLVEEDRIRPYIRPLRILRLLVKLLLITLILVSVALVVDRVRYSKCNTIGDYNYYLDHWGIRKTSALKQINSIKEILYSSIPDDLRENCRVNYPLISVESASAINQILGNMIFVKGGEFYMGRDPNMDFFESKKESPRHIDSVDDFWISQFEMSAQEYNNLIGEKTSMSYDIPLVNVSWYCADSIAMLLRSLTGLPFDLPTEQQWEYAATAEGKIYSHYSGGNDAIKIAWCKIHPQIGDSAHRRNDNIAPIDCNMLDLYDMSGNVWEWCKNNFYSYADGHVFDSKTIRGGSFRSELYQLSITYRDTQSPNEKSDDLGFRLVINALEK